MFLTADLIGKIDAYLCKAIRWGYNGNHRLSELLHNADMKLFRSMLHSTHCIYQLLPPLKFMPIKLRTSHCAFAPPYCHYNLYKHSFVLRCIFDGNINCLYWCLGFNLLFHVFLSSYYFNFFLGNAVLTLYTQTHTLSLSLLYFCYSYYMSFSVLLDGVWLSRNKRITYLLNVLHR